MFAYREQTKSEPRQFLLATDGKIDGISAEDGRKEGGGRDDKWKLDEDYL